MSGQQGNDYTRLSSYEIGLLADEMEKKLKEALHDQQVVDEAILLISKDILNLQIRKKDLQMSKSKADHNVRELSLELRRARNAFFTAKNSGL